MKDVKKKLNYFQFCWMEILQDEVDAVRRNTVSAGSRRAYGSSIAKFLLWLVENKPMQVTEELLALTPYTLGTVCFQPHFFLKEVQW
jgi:hypothetical protein